MLNDSACTASNEHVLLAEQKKTSCAYLFCYEAHQVQQRISCQVDMQAPLLQNKKRLCSSHC